MPYNINSPADNSPKYQIHIRGTAMIPRLNQMAPCRVNLSYNMIETLLESLHRHPLRVEVMYVDASGKEWALTYANFRKILPKPVPQTPPPVSRRMDTHSNPASVSQVDPPSITPDPSVIKAQMYKPVEKEEAPVVDPVQPDSDVIDEVTTTDDESSPEEESSEESSEESRSMYNGNPRRNNGGKHHRR